MSVVGSAPIPVWYELDGCRSSSSRAHVVSLVIVSFFIASPSYFRVSIARASGSFLTNADEIRAVPFDSQLGQRRQRLFLPGVQFTRSRIGISSPRPSARERRRWVCLLREGSAIQNEVVGAGSVLVIQNSLSHESGSAKRDKRALPQYSGLIRSSVFSGARLIHQLFGVMIHLGSTSRTNQLFESSHRIFLYPPPIAGTRPRDHGAESCSSR